MEETNCYVIPYQNPDLDGVASAIAYATLKCASGARSYKAAYFGQLNTQTEFSLAHFGMEWPVVLASIPVRQFILVDTHHVNQLPSGFQCQSVIEIVDHHPGGDPEAFPNASIQNETVGAVATLIAEKFFKSSLPISPEIAGMLACAIVSNTINFAAPSATERDRIAFERLKTHCSISESLVTELFRATFPIDNKTSLECIQEDVKIFVFGNARVGLSQLEAIGIQGLVYRSDFAEAMSRFKSEHHLEHLLFNGVDLAQKVSWVQVDSFQSATLFSKVLDVQLLGNAVCMDRIILRKSDLVGPLGDWFRESESQ